MDTPPIVSPEDQSATFVELFFDLVFWLVWWAWTQFTWILNAADTTHTVIDLATLVATAVVFFVAVTLPDAFHGRALWFSSCA